MALLLGLFTGATALWHYVLWTVLVGLIVGYTYTNSMFHCLSGAVERQKRMNIHEIILTAAMLAGSLLGGAFLDRFGMDFIMIFVAIITVVSFIMQWAVDYYFRKRKKSV